MKWLQLIVLSLLLCGCRVVVEPAYEPYPPGQQEHDDVRDEDEDEDGDEDQDN